MDCIIYMHVLKKYAASYLHRNLEKILLPAEKEKKRKYLEAFLQKCLHFSPFIVSVGGLPLIK